MARAVYQKACSGDLAEMLNLGQMYEHDTHGVTGDISEALKWFRKAAAGGNAEAMYHLGWLHDGGLNGVAKDEAEAVGWYLKGTEAGHAEAMRGLAWMHRWGRGGLAKDEGEAARLFHRSAEAGSANAMIELGEAYENGQLGLTNSGIVAKAWYEKALASRSDSIEGREAELQQAIARVSPRARKGAASTRGLKVFLGLLGFAFVVGGALLIYNWYQNTQTLGYRLSANLGNDAVVKNVARDLWAGMFVGLIGFVLIAVAAGKRQ